MDEHDDEAIWSELIDLRDENARLTTALAQHIEPTKPQYYVYLNYGMEGNTLDFQPFDTPEAAMTYAETKFDYVPGIEILKCEGNVLVEAFTCEFDLKQGKRIWKVVA